MAKNKLKKFSILSSYENVFQNPNAKTIEVLDCHGHVRHLKGKWHEDVFGNDNPIVLELACGRGEYTVALGESNPHINYVGIDIKGARMYEGARIADEKKLKNVAFLRTRIEQIQAFFDSGEISEIWITFPDPFLRESKASKRLTSLRFMTAYKNILAHGGIIHLKTDDPDLYLFTLDTWHDPLASVDIVYTNEDIYAEELVFNELLHKTYYEKMHLLDGRKIKYIRAAIRL